MHLPKSWCLRFAITLHAIMNKLNNGIDVKGRVDAFPWDHVTNRWSHALNDLRATIHYSDIISQTLLREMHSLVFLQENDDAMIAEGNSLSFSNERDSCILLPRIFALVLRNICPANMCLGIILSRIKCISGPRRMADKLLKLPNFCTSIS